MLINLTSVFFRPKMSLIPAIQYSLMLTFLRYNVRTYNKKSHLYCMKSQGIGDSKNISSFKYKNDEVVELLP
jgi:hypothetical protein